MKKYGFYLVLFFCQIVFSQTLMKGQVLDFDSTVPIAFAKIDYGNHSVFTDWEGKFELEIQQDNRPIVFSKKGYHTKNHYLTFGKPFLIIKLVSDESLKNQEIYSENLVNTIIKNVVTNKNKNQPERVFNSFEYKNYEYLLVSAQTDSISSSIDTIVKKRWFSSNKISLDSTNYKFKKLLEKQHLYQTEKVNQIQFNQKGTKETIIAARMAGFQKPLFEFLGLNLVSYSLYNNKLDILEIPVHNPTSNNGRLLFNFKLIDTVSIDGRQAFRIYFQPKNLKKSSLRGLIFIDAENFGIAKAFYRIYGIVNINALFTFSFLENEKIWFPKKRDITVVKGNNSEDLKILGGTIKFRSSIEKNKKDASDNLYLKLESTPFDIKINEPVTFETPKIKIDARQINTSKPDSYWNLFKKDTIDSRKLNTYLRLDSLSLAEKIEKKIILGKKIINGYLPISYVDIDLRSLAKYNNHEGFRFGLGGVTNSKLSEVYKIHFYGAYGLKDEVFKFGISPSYLIDKETDTWVTASYLDDISEIGQTQFATQSRRYKLYDPRPLNISTFYQNKSASVSVESKFIPKTETYIGLSSSTITPLFNYVFSSNGNQYSSYSISAAQFAIQWNPFSNYMQTTSDRIENEKKWPKFSFQITKSIPNFVGNDFNFTKFDFKIIHEIPYLSGQSTSFYFMGGVAVGNLPLTHLYSIVPNNLNKETLLQRITFAGKNSFETMYFNEFFSSKYFSFQARHTFNKVKLAYKIKPKISVVSRFAFGSMDQPENHLNFAYNTLEKGFFESGIEMNQIYQGFGLTGFFRYGPYAFSKIEDNISIKISYVLDLGF